MEELEKRKIKFIAIAKDSVWHLTKFAEKNGYTFTMIADLGANLAKKYNVYTFGSLLDISSMKTKIAIPSDFLINKEGIIVWRILNTRTVRPSMEALLEAIEKYITNPNQE